MFGAKTSWSIGKSRKKPPKKKNKAARPMGKGFGAAADPDAKPDAEPSAAAPPDPESDLAAWRAYCDEAMRQAEAIEAAGPLGLLELDEEAPPPPPPQGGTSGRAGGAISMMASAGGAKRRGGAKGGSKGGAKGAGGGFGGGAAVRKPGSQVSPKKRIERAMRAYAALRGEKGAADRAVDVYVKGVGPLVGSSGGLCRFWYVGKAVGCAGSDGAQAEAQEGFDGAASVLAQKRLILEHAKLLQRELKEAAALELWWAPPNTEVAVARRQQQLHGMEGLRLSEAQRSSPDDCCGFSPEVYTAEDRKGFYVKLPADGVPLDGSEVQTRFVTPEEATSELGLDLSAHS